MNTPTTPPTRAWDSSGWGISYFNLVSSRRHLRADHAEIRPRVRRSFLDQVPAAIYAGYSPLDTFEVWWTSWAYLRQGLARIRLSAGVGTTTGKAASAEFQISQFTLSNPGDTAWTPTLRLSLRPSPPAGSGRQVRTIGEAQFPAAGWYLFSVAYRYDGTIAADTSPAVSLDWLVPGQATYMPVEGYAFHPTFLHPGNWPSGASRPLGG